MKACVSRCAVAIAAAFLITAGTAVAAPSSLQRQEFVPGELLVKFKPTVTKSLRAVTRSALHGKLAARLNGSEVERWRLAPGEEVKAAARRLRASGQVEYAEPNYIRRPLVLPNDPPFVKDPANSNYGQEWGLFNPGLPLQYSDSYGSNLTLAGADMDLADAWNLCNDAHTITIAIVDDGVFLDHEDLKAHLLISDGYDFVQNDTDPSPVDTSCGDADGCDDHGTMVAGAAGAVTDNGIGIASPAWNVRLLPLRIDYSSAQIAEAYDYAIAHGADIVNASFGGGPFSQTEFDAAKRLRDANNGKGVLLVTAAGNGAYSNDDIPDNPSSFDLSNVLAVAASDPQDNPSLFTQLGAMSVDVAAPGSSIYTTKWTATKAADGTTTLASGYGFASGTSFSAPYVASVAALVKAYRTYRISQGDPAPDSWAQELKGRIMAGVDTKTAFEGRLATDGRVNAYKAMIVQPQPELVVKSFRIDDSTTGNGNGALDPGETVQLYITLDNSWIAANTITATLTSEATALTVADPNGADFPSIGSGQSGESSTPFTIQVAADAASYQKLPLTLTVNADGSIQTRHFALALGALSAGTHDDVFRKSNDYLGRTDYWDRVHVYHFEVPKGVASMTVSTSSRSAALDADLALRRGKPTKLTDCYYYADTNCRPDGESLYATSPTSNESLIVTNPQAGTWFATVIAMPTSATSPDAHDAPYSITVSFRNGSDGGGGGALGWMWLTLIALIVIVWPQRR